MKSLVLPVLGIALVAFTYVFFAVHYHHRAMMAPDESFYTLAARNVMEGEILYRDFAYTQSPLMPYINGIIMSAAGFDLNTHRTINAVWGALGLIIMCALIRHRTGKWEPAIMAGFIVAASIRWVSVQTLGVWCGPGGAFLNLAMAAVMWRGRLTRRIVLFAVAGTVAIGIRISCAPVVAVLFLATAVEAPSIKKIAAHLAVCLTVGAAAFAPFFLLAPDNFVFHVWDYHMGAAFERNPAAQAMQWWNISPAVITVTTAAAFSIPSLFKGRRRQELVLLVAGIVGITTPMIPSSAWGVYIAAGVPVAAAGAASAFWAVSSPTSNPARHVVWLLPVMSIFTTTPVEVPGGAATEVTQVAAKIAAEAPDGPILTPVTIVAVEAERRVIDGTEMGTFSAMAPGMEMEAARRRMTTLPVLAQKLRDREPAAVVKMIDPAPWRVWNFRWILPSLDDQPRDAIKEYENALAENYRSVLKTSTMELFFPGTRTP